MKQLDLKNGILDRIVNMIGVATKDVSTGDINYIDGSIQDNLIENIIRTVKSISNERGAINGRIGSGFDVTVAGNTFTVNPGTGLTYNGDLVVVTSAKTLQLPPGTTKVYLNVSEDFMPNEHKSYTQKSKLYGGSANPDVMVVIDSSVVISDTPDNGNSILVYDDGKQLVTGIAGLEGDTIEVDTITVENIDGTLIDFTDVHVKALKVSNMLKTKDLTSSSIDNKNNYVGTSMATQTLSSGRSSFSCIVTDNLSIDGSITSTGTTDSSNIGCDSITATNISNVDSVVIRNDIHTSNANLNSLTVNGDADVSGDVNIGSDIKFDASTGIVYANSFSGVSGGDTPLGGIIMAPDITAFKEFGAPPHYLFHLCDGEEVNAEYYHDLSTVIGDTYGGTNFSQNPDGTFNGTIKLPDLIKRYPMGYNMGSGYKLRLSNDNTPNTSIDIGSESPAGLWSITLTEEQIPSHTHTYKIPEGSYYQHQNDSNKTEAFENRGEETDEGVGIEGDGHSNIPRSLQVKFFIRVKLQ